MIKQLGKIRADSKEIHRLYLFLVLYAILLIPLAFLLRGMVVGLLGLPIVVIFSTRFLTKGGVISALWTSCVMILTFFVSPFDIGTFHIVGGITVYFIIGIGVGKHLEMIQKNQFEITVKKEALIREKKQFEALFKNSLDAIVFLDKDYLILDANQPFMRLFGYEPKDVIGLNIDDVMDMGKAGTAYRELTKQLILGGEQVIAESTRYGKDGNPVEVIIKGVPIIIDGELVGGYTIYDDITYRKYYEKQLKYLSFHDQLTNLYNRLSFEKSIEQLSSGNEYPISIITADLNGLKLINDTMGHHMGDELLKASADIFKRSVRNSDIVFRIGGDEFGILMPLTGETISREVVKQIHASIKLYNNDHAETPVSLSIGVATAENKEVPLKEVFKRADDLMYREKLYQSTSVRAQLINALMAALAERDNITEGHAQRLTDLSLEIAKKAGLPPHHFGSLSLLAQVHDLGKVGIPDNILCKNGPLTEKEWETMRLHPEKGYRIALSSPDLSGIADLILKHHERWDGTGYPLGIKGEEIPLECRILAIVDSFDAMINDRPYSKARSIEEAIEEIKRCSGTQFDPELVSIFLSVLNS
jgi:diguanylate cyclase (GGDEF)-like protein/PAS domain S-box-containing protein